MPKLLASSQITITDLNDTVSLRSHILSSHARVQLLNNNNTYIPNLVASNLVLTAEMNKIGSNTNLVANPGVLVSRIAWYVKLAPSQTYVEITPAMTQYELSGTAPLYKGLKVKSNIMSASTPGATFKVEIDYKEAWMPEPHTQISEIDFSLTIQGNNGTDSYTPLLTNTAHTVICQNTGTPLDGELGINGRASSETLCYRGTSLLSPVASNPSTGQYSISLESDDAEVIRKSDNKSFYINSFENTENSFKVKVVFNIEGQSSMTQEMTISKVYNGTNGLDGVAGNNGEPARYIRIVSLEGGTVFKKNAEGVYETDTIRIQADTFNIDNPTYKWYGRVNNSWTLISGQSNKTLSIPVTHDFFDTADSVAFRCMVKDVYHDEITISKLADGLDSITVHLTNDSHVINCFYDGTPKPNELTTATTDIEVYKGYALLPIIEDVDHPNYYSITIEKESSVTTTLDGNTLKVTAINTDSTAIIIKINFGDKTFVKTMSLSKARDGKEGEDGYIASLTNEYHALPANNSGTVTSYSGCSTSIELRKGSDLVTSGVTYSASPGSGVTGSFAGNTYTVTRVTEDMSTVSLTATHNGKTYTKIFTVAKNKQGATGTAGSHSSSYWLVQDVTSLHIDKAGNLNVDKIVFSAKVKTGNSAVADLTTGSFEIFASINGGDYSSVYKSASGQSSYTYTLPANLSGLRCYLREHGSNTILDIRTTQVSHDGADGIDGTDAAYVKLHGENIFKYGPNYIGTPEPSSIVLSRSLYNTSGGSWQYHNGTAWTAFSPAQTGTTITIGPAMGHFATSSNRRMSVRYMVNANIYDEINLIKVADGAVGEDAYSVLLSNPSHIVPCSHTGEPISGAIDDAITEVVAYKAAEKKTVTITGFTSSPSTVVFEKEGTNKIKLKTFPNNIDTGICTINFTVDERAFTQVFSVSKAKTGVPGNAAKIVRVSGPNVFKYLEGSSTPVSTTISLSAVEQNFTGSSRKWYADGTVISGQTGTNLSVSHSASYWGSKEAITFKYEADGISDSITVTKLRDGSDTYSVVLGNEAHTIACDKNGNPLSGEIAKAFTDIKVFKGATQLEASNVAASGKFSIYTTAEIPGSAGTCSYVQTSGINTGVKLVTMTANTASIPITIRLESSSNNITKNFTITKTKVGADGLAAKVLQIHGASSIIQNKDGSYNPSSGIVLTADKKNTSGTVVWKNGSTTLGEGDSYTVPTSVFNSNVVYNIRAEIKGDTGVYDLHSISKVTDGVDSVMAYIWAPDGTTIRNSATSSLNVEAVMFNGSTNISATSSASYHWQKKVGANWVNIKGTSSAFVSGSSGGNTITVSQDDIPQTLIVRCNMKFESQVQTDTIVLEDINDPVHSNIFSTNGTIFKNGEGETYLVAKTIRNGVSMDVIKLVDAVPTTAGVQGEIVFVKNRRDDSYYKYNNTTWSKIDTPSYGDNSTYTYTWTKTDKDGDIVTGWSREGKVIYITNSEVDGSGDFMVDITG